MVKNRKVLIVIAIVTVVVTAVAGILAYNAMNNKDEELSSKDLPNNERTDTNDKVALDNNTTQDPQVFDQIDIPELNATLKITNNDCEIIADNSIDDDEASYSIICRNMRTYGRAIILIDPIITGGGFGLFEIQKAENIQSNANYLPLDQAEYEILSMAFPIQLQKGISTFDFTNGNYFTSTNYDQNENSFEVVEVFFSNTDDKYISEINGHTVILGFEVVAYNDSMQDSTISPIEEMIATMLDIFTNGLELK